jgi:hypothetical protein
LTSAETFAIARNAAANETQKEAEDPSPAPIGRSEEIVTVDGNKLNIYIQSENARIRWHFNAYKGAHIAKTHPIMELYINKNAMIPEAIPILASGRCFSSTRYFSLDIISSESAFGFDP